MPLGEAVSHPRGGRLPGPHGGAHPRGSSVEPTAAVIAAARPTTAAAAVSATTAAATASSATATAASGRVRRAEGVVVVGVALAVVEVAVEQVVHVHFVVELFAASVVAASTPTTATVSGMTHPGDVQSRRRQVGFGPQEVAHHRRLGHRGVRHQLLHPRQQRQAQSLCFRPGMANGGGVVRWARGEAGHSG